MASEELSTGNRIETNSRRRLIYVITCIILPSPQHKNSAGRWVDWAKISVRPNTYRQKKKAEEIKRKLV